MSETSRYSFTQADHVRKLEDLADEARVRRDAERTLEVLFLRRLRDNPERLGLQTGLEVHGTRRLEAALACESLSRRLDVARAAIVTSGARNVFADLL